jgi:hypothetical protein
MTRRISLALAAAAIALVAGCSENLNTPSECPQLCPSEQVPVQSIDIVPTTDTVFPPDRAEGYQDRASAQSLRVTTLVGAGEPADPVVGTADLAVIGFLARPDSVTIQDTARPVIAVDSVAISFRLQGRDTTANGLALLVYRAPEASGVDSGSTYAELAAVLQPANAVDTLPVHDTLVAGSLRSVLTGADIARLGPGAAGPTGEDSLVVVLALAADRPTGVRLASRSLAADAPSITSYVRVQFGDTVLAQTLPAQRPAYNTFVSSETPALPVDSVTIGGAPATRGFYDFELPALVRDSVRIVRATLELTPVRALTGLRGDPAALEARVPIIDLGVKSPLYPRTTVPAGVVLVEAETSTAIGIEVTHLVRLWQADSTRPSAFVVSVSPEGATFTNGVFYSIDAPDPAVRPRLRIDYVLPFDFEAP